MRLGLAIAALLTAAATTPACSAFVPSISSTRRRQSASTSVCFSSVADRAQVAVLDDDEEDNRPQLARPAVTLSSTEYLERLNAQLEKLRQKDKLSPLISKEVSV